jgi:hypothetical protein
MFGKPAWFRKKKVSWGLRPVSWQGWLYAGVWVGVICLPFVGLLASHLLFESLVWVVVMMVALLWDVHQIRRDMDMAHQQDTADVLVIDENTEPDPSCFATRSYDLRLRRGKP